MTDKLIDTKSFCNSLYKELFGMKSKLEEFASTIEHTEGKTKEALQSYTHHLREMANFIEWKLEIFSKVCPVDWSKLDMDVESKVSVPPVETGKESEMPAGGYVGG